MKGTYELSGAHGPYAVESFTCAPGPLGWRYVGTRDDLETDLTLDDTGHVVRLVARAGGVEVRGGAAPPDVVWRRGDTEHTARAAGFSGSSPAFLVATARLLGPVVGARRRVRLVQLGDDALAPLTVEQGWALTRVQQVDGLPVQRWEVADLATGEQRVVHLVGDVVVDATGVRLLSLDGPPHIGP